jgi:hypothetical protein
MRGASGESGLPPGVEAGAVRKRGGYHRFQKELHGSEADGSDKFVYVVGDRSEVEGAKRDAPVRDSGARGASWSGESLCAVGGDPGGGPASGRRTKTGYIGTGSARLCGKFGSGIGANACCRGFLPDWCQFVAAVRDGIGQPARLLPLGYPRVVFWSPRRKNEPPDFVRIPADGLCL